MAEVPKKPVLTELDEDCLTEIFRNLDEKDLYNLLTVSDKFLYAVLKNIPPKTFTIKYVEELREKLPKETVYLLCQRSTGIDLTVNDKGISFLEEYGHHFVRTRNVRIEEAFRENNDNFEELISPLLKSAGKFELKEPPLNETRSNHPVDYIRKLRNVQKVKFDGPIEFTEGALDEFFEKNHLTIKEVMIQYNFNLMYRDTLPSSEAFVMDDKYFFQLMLIPNLTKIYLQFPSTFTEINRFIDIVAGFDRIEFLKISVNKYINSKAYNFNPTFTMNALHTLHLYQYDKVYFTNTPNLKELKLYHPDTLTLDKITQILDNLPKLEVLRLFKYRFNCLEARTITSHVSRKRKWIKFEYADQHVDLKITPKVYLTLREKFPPKRK